MLAYGQAVARRLVGWCAVEQIEAPYFAAGLEQRHEDAAAGAKRAATRPRLDS